MLLGNWPRFSRVRRQRPAFEMDSLSSQRLRTQCLSVADKEASPVVYHSEVYFAKCSTYGDRSSFPEATSRVCIMGKWVVHTGTYHPRRSASHFQYDY